MKTLHSPFTLGTKCYAVTPHHQIIPLVIVSITTHEDDVVEVTTEIVEDKSAIVRAPDGYYIRNHQTLFVMKGDSLTTAGCVFTSRSDAKDYVIKVVTGKIEAAKQDIRNFKNLISEL